MTTERKRWDEILDRIPADRPFAMVEVGVWVGELSDHLLSARPLLELHMVDLWTPKSQGPRLTGLCAPQDAKRRAEEVAARHGSRAVIHHGDSVIMSEKFANQSLDGGFIDAKHGFHAVKRDLAAWTRKIKLGGWIGGHDWAERFPGVEQAVVRAFPRESIELGADYCWFVKLF